ncbi:hypothetical protein DFQ27_009221 [Actinomortierella ambigua]|uniref:Carboxylic ester hydrolase n=1 Tax=Actinomortierella ambigua TaxID=1343610 RepID=A0A9P6PQB1_9FUNG|nr:hypothetical protein DFQ27_009221 [Actinomortierella ambigua]
MYPFKNTSRRIQIETPVGPMVGWRDQNAFRFLGIPYAEPPVGELRWAKPVPKRHLGKTFDSNHDNNNTTINSMDSKDQKVWDATKYGNICPQTPAGWFPKMVAMHVNGAPDSEDCLYLNVYTPSLKSPGGASTGLPVIFYIHGSMFTQYSSSLPILNPGHLVARGGVIVVSLNYRLGFLGFLETADDNNKDKAGASSSWTGNQAIHDQIVALQWVRDNIASFGGDPTRVTLMGVSAGATSIRALLAAKEAWPLYRNVIAQSDPIAFPFKPAEVARYEAAVFFGRLGCQPNDLRCARQKTMGEILAAQMNTTGELMREYRLQSHDVPGDMDGSSSNSSAASSGRPRRWWTAYGVFHRPMVDYDLLTADFSSLVQSGEINPNAPILWGTTQDDAGYFMSLFWSTPIPIADAAKALERMLPADRISAILMASKQFFPLDPQDSDTVRNLASWYGTRVLWFCPLRYLSQGLAAVPTTSLSSAVPLPQPHANTTTTTTTSITPPRSAPVYVYRFHRGRNLPFSQDAFCNEVSSHRVCHASDVQPGLGSGDCMLSQTQDGDDARYARQVMDRFTSFAKTGNPNPVVVGQQQQQQQQQQDDDRAAMIGGGWEATNPDVASVIWTHYNSDINNSNQENAPQDAILEIRLDGSAMSVGAEREVCDWMDQQRLYPFLTDLPA